MRNHLTAQRKVKAAYNSCRKMSNDLAQFEALMGHLMDITMMLEVKPRYKPY